MVQAFKDVKDSLAKQTLLHHPIKDAPIAVTSDASDIAMGAVLEQKVHNHTVVKNGKFSTIILSDDKRVRYVTYACHWTSKTSRTSKKLKKANEGRRGQIKGQTQRNITF